jgi:parallel beta-helix repeat protein
MLTLFMLCILISGYKIKPAKGTWTGTVYIRADGSIDPPDAPIITHDNVTYMLTDNITSSADGIVVERDNIIIDGASYTIEGAGSGTGISLSRRNNVTIKNTNIINFGYGIDFWYSSNNIIAENNVTNNWYGMYLYSSSSNSISGNNIIKNYHPGAELSDGIQLMNSNDNVISDNNITANEFCGIDLYNGIYGCSNNIISGNYIRANVQGISLWEATNNTIRSNIIIANEEYGIDLSDSSNNTIEENEITKNKMTTISSGIELSSSDGNIIKKNNITDNTYGIKIAYFSWGNVIIENNITANDYYGIEFWADSSFDNIIYHNNFLDNAWGHVDIWEALGNVWDNGYPWGGNYWSDYYGTDLFKGPNQDQHGSDGIGDSPYVIDSQNMDNYPLMYPYGSPPPPYYNLTITVTTGGTTEPSPGTYAYVNSTTVAVTAFSKIGYSFDYWLLDGKLKTENPISIFMDSNRTLEAYFVDDIPPEISEPWQDPPPNNVQPHQNVTLWVNVTDYGTGIKNVTLWYSLDNGTTWTILNMTELPIPSNGLTVTYEATILGYENCTWITYKIIAFDNARNNATKDNNGYFYKYHVIPEFPSSVALLGFLVLITTLIVFIQKKHHPKTK